MWFTRKVVPYMILGLLATPIGVTLYPLLAGETQNVFIQQIWAVVAAFVSVATVLVIGVCVAVVRTLIWGPMIVRTENELRKED
jgi:hypothetical protein